MTSYWFKKAYLIDQWQSNVTITVSDSGDISTVASDTNPDNATVIDGFAMPGFPNIHSHAFQRVMAGLGEKASSLDDNFWSWRNIMYQFANMISPEDQQAIAAQLYMEMLKAGYTSVAEFHYLHNLTEGKPYANPIELSLATISASKQTGIGLTHLPVLYMTSNFGGKPLKKEQMRFHNSLESYQAMLQAITDGAADNKPDKLGIALHSLRAVPEAAITETLAHINRLDNTAPIHIHIAEQTLEVDESIRWSGKRPVEWLLSNHDIDDRWCLIHATHLNDQEVTAVARSGAAVGICPTTEANLGDGIFPLASYLQQGGKIAIGSDSNTSVSPIEELRWLEYGQRLKHHQRNIGATLQTPHTAENLVQKTLAGGAKALGRKVGKIDIGYSADLLVLDEQSPHLYQKRSENIFDSLVFCGNTAMIRDVMCKGQWCVKNYQHINEAAITENYRATIAHLQKNLH